MQDVFSPELLYGVGAAILLLAIGYGVFRDKTRNKRKDALTEEATRRSYENPERYRKREQKKFEKAAED